MLSDSIHRKHVKSKPIRALDAKTNRTWSDKQKIEAVQSHMLLGNLALVSRVLGIPEVTLRVWKRSQWWHDAVAELRSQRRIELSSKMQKIVDASLSVVEDRLLNGDYQFDQKTGEVVRKPVNMKDAHKVAVDLQERQEALEKMERPELDTTEDRVEDKLLKLAEKFAEMATKKIEQKQLDERTIDEARIVREYSQEEGTDQEGVWGNDEETRNQGSPLQS